jgi:putative transposase
MVQSSDGPVRDRWARLRFSIVGPLLAAPPAAGELYQALQELSAKTWRHPATGMPIQFGVSTIERWFYSARAAHQDPVSALKTRVRADAGSSRLISEALIAAIEAQYREHPSWSCQLHYDNLRVALAEQEAFPSYSTLRRYLKARGLFKQPRVRRSPGELAAELRRGSHEVRSFELEHVNALWHLDFHHGARKVLSASGQWVTPILLGVLDDRSRLAAHVQWYLDETAESLVHGLSQAFMKRALPRSLMTDNGSAMVCEEFVSGLQALGIVHETTLPYSAYQNAKQEVFWARVEGRLMAMLEGVEPLRLELLNTATQAWVEQEYQRSVHGEIKTSPLARYLAGPDVGRESPDSASLRRAFRMPVTRRQRISDGTVSLDGQRFEIPARYRHLERVHLRYARWDLASVDLVDAQRGTLLCALYPLDKAAHANSARRPLEALQPNPTPMPATSMAPLLKKLMADYAATGLPPAYLPTHPDTEPT